MRIKRYRFLIAPRVQLQILGYLAVFSLAKDAYLYFVFQLLIGNQGEALRRLTPNPNAGFELTLQEAPFLVSELFFYPTALTYVFLAAAGIVITHRLVGPIHRLRGHLARIREEGAHSAGQIRFRQHDYFQELANEVNQTLATPLLEAKADGLTRQAILKDDSGN